MASAAPDTRVLTFSLGDERLGLSAALVHEIAPMPRLARVPHAPDALLGVANMRGTVVPVLSLARLLGRPESAIGRVVVAEADGPVGLAVTSVSQVVEADVAGVSRIDLAALIARAVPERKRQRGAGAASVAAQADTAAAETVALVSFAVGTQDFALPLTSIAEVLRLPSAIARMPQADDAVVGSAAVRGAVLPLLSLAGLLGLAITAPTPRSRIVVARIGGHRVGLLVDAMHAIERVAESAIDPVPQALARNESEARIQAICRMDGGTRLLSVLSPDRLLHEDITARLLHGDTGDQHEMTGAAMGERTERFLIFRVGEDTFGLPIGAVEEVAQLPPRLTPLPKAPDFVQGVMNVRGRVVPVIDQARRFTGAPVAGVRPRVIVVRIGELVAGFSVDAVAEVLEVPADALREAPDLGGEGTRVFDRVASVAGHDGLVLIVSPQELLDRAERDLLASLGTKAAKTRT